MKILASSANERKKLYLLLLLAALGVVLFAPTAFSHAYSRPSDNLSDFYQHMRWAKSLQNHGADSIPSFVLAHSGWEFLLIFMNQAFGFSLEQAGFVATLISAELTVLLLFWWYWPALSEEDPQVGKIALIILGVGIAAPVSLLWPLDNLLYLGYIGINTYHNPTIILLKPLAIIQFIFAYRCFSSVDSIGKGWVLGAMLISLLSTYVKPSLAIALLPALTVLVVYRQLLKEYVNVKALVLGIGPPTILVLAWQFFVTYYSKEGSGITILPLGVMSAFSKYLALKFLLSILFPLAVLIVFFKRVKQDIRLVLGWLIFLFGAAFTYFFAEPERLLEGNFGWSGEIALVLLFAVSTLFYFEVPQKTRFERTFLTGVWSLHVIFGLIYYAFAILNKPYV